MLVTVIDLLVVLPPDSVRPRQSLTKPQQAQARKSCSVRGHSLTTHEKSGMRRPGSRPRFVPAGLVLALASARKSVTRAFNLAGCSTGLNGQRGLAGSGKRLWGAAQSESSTATPPESPLPPKDGDLVSFFLLRHGQTNFNAIGRIQVRLPVTRCLCTCVLVDGTENVRFLFEEGGSGEEASRKILKLRICLSIMTGLLDAEF